MFNKFRNGTVIEKITTIAILLVFIFSFGSMCKNPQGFSDAQPARGRDVRSANERIDELERRIERLERQQ